MRTALGALQQSIATRNDKLAALDIAVSHAGTAGSIAALAGTASQRADRLNIRAAQEATRTAVLWTAVGTFILALVIAVGISLSISRRVGGLAAAVIGLAEGALDTAVPGTKLSDELGAVAGAISLLRQKTLEQRAAQDMRFEAALNNMRQGLLMLDASGGVSVSNRRLAAMFGVDTLVDGPPDKLVEQVLRTGSLTERTAKALFLLPKLESTPTSSAYELPDGRTVKVSRQPVEDGGWVFTYEDITERRQSEARLDHMALHDALTDLPNRVLFQIHLDRELSRIGRGERLAVVFLDLDRF
jgi:PAS domain-containing protein